MQISVLNRIAIQLTSRAVLFNLDNTESLLSLAFFCFVTFSPDGLTMIVTRREDYFALRDSYTGTGIAGSRTKGFAQAAAFSPDGRTVAVAQIGSPGFSLFEVPTLTKLLQIGGPTSETPQTIAWSPSGEFVAVQDGSETLCLFDAATFVKLSTLRFPEMSLSFFFSPLSPTLLVSSGHRLNFIGLPMFDERASVFFPNRFKRSTISPDGEHVAMSRLGGGIDIFSFATGKIKFVTGVSPHHIAWGPSSDKLYALDFEDRVFVFDMMTEKKTLVCQL